MRNSVGIWLLKRRAARLTSNPTWVSPIRRRLPACITGWVITAGLSAFLCACSSSQAQEAVRVSNGNPQRGRAAIAKYGCGSCHTIAGIREAEGLVGPPLTGVASRLYIAGVLSNTPDNMVRWIRNPTEVDRKTAMPALGVTQQEAADITAFLYSTK